MSKKTKARDAECQAFCTKFNISVDWRYRESQHKGPYYFIAFAKYSTTTNSQMMHITKTLEVAKESPKLTLRDALNLLTIYEPAPYFTWCAESGNDPASQYTASLYAVESNAFLRAVTLLGCIGLLELRNLLKGEH